MTNTYWAQSCAFQTSAAPAVTATGATIKSLLEVATPSGANLNVIEWGISLDTPASASIVKAELVQCDVTMTGTALTPELYFDPNGPASAMTAKHTSTAEGTVTATRSGDIQLLVPPYVYVKQFPLGREFKVPPSKYLRVRVTASVTCNAYAYVIWDE